MSLDDTVIIIITTRNHHDLVPFGNIHVLIGICLQNTDRTKVIHVLFFSLMEGISRLIDRLSGE
ncbi:hypothetical protein BI364_04030 [Acidihalobacter yilgarnensis]|uniref:Uncharacterized protein n=1 Tax=Acidihalobacter yilgarnensis TaxID=2819280 RepID=A0A1D8ILE5_9GAMM|nr:hypothetical protein BI364_04030 [Acidihalobacter yilgarnensis]